MRARFLFEMLTSDCSVWEDPVIETGALEEGKKSFVFFKMEGPKSFSFDDMKVLLTPINGLERISTADKEEDKKGTII